MLQWKPPRDHGDTDPRINQSGAPLPCNCPLAVVVLATFLLQDSTRSFTNTWLEPHGQQALGWKKRRRTVSTQCNPNKEPTTRRPPPTHTPTHPNPHTRQRAAGRERERRQGTGSGDENKKETSKNPLSGMGPTSPLEPTTSWAGSYPAVHPVPSHRNWKPSNKNGAIWRNWRTCPNLSVSEPENWKNGKL